MGRDGCIAECRRRIDQYAARKKEIEDSYIEAGLELPLASRNLNASVYRNGSQFEPTNNDYRRVVMAEAGPNPAAYAPSGDYEGMSGTELKNELSVTMERLSAADRAMVDAEIRADGGEVSRLKEETVILRARADDLVRKIREINAPRAEPAPSPGRSEDVERLERDIASLRSQMSMVRGDLEDVKESVRALLRRFSMDEDD